MIFATCKGTETNAPQPSTLAFAVVPANAVAGGAMSPAVVVLVQDGSGNTVTTATTSITIAVAPASGALWGTTTVAAVGGVATFSNLCFDKAGNGYTLVASATGLTSATSATFSVSAGAASKLAFAVQPANATAGTAISPAVAVTVQDAVGNTVTTATTSITVAIGTNPASGTLSGTTAAAAVSGTATFSNLSVDKAGTGYTLAAAATGLTGATSSAFNITPGAAAKTAFTVQPTNVTAGAAINPAVAVAVQDASGNTVTTATTSITVAIGTNPASGTLSGTATVAAVSGVATFSNLSVNKAGTGYTLTAAATGLTGATSSAFNVTTGAASKLAFTAQPTNVAAGAAMTPAVQVTIQDALGNTVTTATTSITVAIGTNPASGILSGTATVAAVSGAATFSNLSINAPGTGYTLTGAASGLTGATSSAFNVTAAATKLAFTVQPSTVTAGAAISPAVQVAIQDAGGNTVTSASNAISLSIGAWNDTVAQASGTLVAPGNNKHDYVVHYLDTRQFPNGGTLTIDIKVGSGASSASFDLLAQGVAPPMQGPVASISVANAYDLPPGTHTSIVYKFGAGQVFAFGAEGNWFSPQGSTNTYTFVATVGPASALALGGTVTRAAVNGVAAFNDLYITRAGSGYTLTATASGLASATSNVFAVTPSAAARLAFVIQPRTGTAGVVLTPPILVAIQDALANTVTIATNSVTLAITAGTGTAGATLGGNVTVNVTGGMASFSNLSVDRAGSSYTLTATATGLTLGTSGPLDVAASAVTVTGVSPSSGPLAGGTAVTLTGTNFPTTVDSVRVGTGRLGSLVRVSGTQLTGTTPAGSAAGAVDVTVYSTSAGNGICAGCFTYNPAPTVTGVSPSSGPLAGGTAVTVTGTNFPTTVDSVRVGTARLGSLVRVSATQLTGTTPAGSAMGAVDVVVYTTSVGNGTCAGCFTYTLTVSGVSPSSGPLAGGTALTITGTNFPTTVDSVRVGTGRLGSLVRVSGTQLTGTTPAGSAAGAVDVTVYSTSAGSATCAGCFTYNPLPTVTGVSPSSGSLAGGTAVTLTGTNFPTPVDSVRVGTGRLGSLVRVSGTQLTGTTPAGSAAGAVDVTVYSTSAGSATCAGCFTYNPAVTWTGLTAGPNHTCGVLSSGAAYCWGDNYYGELGDNLGISNTSTPAALAGGLAFASLTAGFFMTCGLTTGGAAYCWGTGELGDGKPEQFRDSPLAVAAGLTFTSLATGIGHTCGLTSGGVAYCWGFNGYGEVGDGTGIDRLAPVPVAGGFTFASLQLADRQTCGLTSGGAAYCWGNNVSGQLGDGSTGWPNTTPVAVVGGLTFTSLATGIRHTCGLTSSGAAYCWGDNSHGELGIGSADTTPRVAPVAVVGGVAFASLTAGYDYTCGLTSGGAAYCWGANSGQLGDGSTTQRLTPAAVAGGLTFASLTAGYAHTCGLTSGGAAYCWGDNSVGQLGDGSIITQRTTPVAVVSP